MAGQVLTGEVDWPEVVSVEKMKEQWYNKPRLPEIGKGHYDHLQNVLKLRKTETSEADDSNV